MRRPVNVAFLHVECEPLLARWKRRVKDTFTPVSADPVRERRSLAAMMIHSARERLGNATLVQLSDTKTPALAGVDTVLRDERFALAEFPLSVNRLRRLYIESAQFNEDTVFADTDVLFNGPLDEVFDQDFDVGLTWREGYPKMPFNLGVIFVRPGCAALAFWRTLEHRITQRDRAERAWFGAQLALPEMLGNPHLDGTFARTRNLCWADTKVRLFPCTRYNYTPLSWPEPVDERLVLHFLGEFKKHMRKYHDAAYPRVLASSHTRCL